MPLRQTLILAVLIASFLGNTTARANPVVAYAAEFVLQYLGGKALDPLWNRLTGQVNVGELGRRLEVCEIQVSRVDRKLSAKLARLRSELDDKVDRDDVEAIVREVLKGLEDRLAAAEARQDRLERRVAELESRLVILPTITPSPIMHVSSSRASAAAHPLVAEWAVLLSRSEQTRLRVAELMRVYRPTARVLQEAVDDDSAILAETDRLRTRIYGTLLAYRDDRDELLSELRESHPKIGDLDRKISSLIWLCGIVNTPGPSKRLQVPEALLGDECSDILMAFDLAGEDAGKIAGLFRILMYVQFERDYELPPSLENCARSCAGEPGDRTLRSAEFPKPLQAEAQTVEALLNRARDLAESVSESSEELRGAEKRYGPAHREVLSLRGQRRSLLARLSSLQTEVEQALDDCLTDYVEVLPRYRPSNPQMRAFRERRLLPLWALGVLAESGDPSSASEQDEAWARFALLGKHLLTEKSRQEEFIRTERARQEKMLQVVEHDRLVGELIALADRGRQLEQDVSALISGRAKGGNAKAILKRQSVMDELRRMKSEMSKGSGIRSLNRASIDEARRKLEAIEQRLQSLGLRDR